MLLIEKVVKLLDDYHFEEFQKYLRHKSLRSYYPSVLVECIDRDFFQHQSIEKLCKNVYGEYDDNTHKKFLQLAHYTFRLTSFLAKNYPDYLFHNITKVQHFINSGELEKGLELIDVLIEVSAKIEDRTTEMKAQLILAQHYAFSEKRDLAVKCFERIEWLQNQEKQLTEILHYPHTHHAVRGANPVEAKDLENHLTFYRQFADSESFYIRFLQKTFSYFFLHIARDKRFYEPKVFEDILECEKDYQKHEFVVTPYLSNFIHVLQFLKLHHFIQVTAKDDVSRKIPELLEENENMLFWKSYFNMTELFSIVILVNFYNSNYFFSYRKNHMAELPEEVIVNMETLKERCEQILLNPQLAEKYITRYINLNILYAALLCCGEEEDIRKSIDILERLLIDYQQIAFHTLTDAIYTVLILGYFCVEDYQNVDKCFRRFKKNQKDKPVTPENFFIIQGVFYIAKWLETQRKQYVKKLSLFLQEPQYQELRKSSQYIWQMIAYFKMPIFLEGD